MSLRSKLRSKLRSIVRIVRFLEIRCVLFHSSFLLCVFSFFVCFDQLFVRHKKEKCVIDCYKKNEKWEVNLEVILRS